MSIKQLWKQKIVSVFNVANFNSSFAWTCERIVKCTGHSSFECLLWQSFIKKFSWGTYWLLPVLHGLVPRGWTRQNSSWRVQGLGKKWVYLCYFNLLLGIKWSFALHKVSKLALYSVYRRYATKYWYNGCYVHLYKNCPMGGVRHISQIYVHVIYVGYGYLGKIGESM